MANKDGHSVSGAAALGKEAAQVIVMKEKKRKDYTFWC